MKINFLNFRWIFILAVATFFTACESDDGLTENFTSAEFNKLDRAGHMGRASCFDLVYPVTIAYPDGTTAVADSKEAIRDLFKTWKEENPDATDRPNIQFPYDIILEDASTATVNDLDELKELVGDCDKGPQGSRRKCYKLVFPLTVDFPDDTSVEFADKADFKAAIKTWREENPDATERPSIAFPYDVTLKDGTTVTVTSEEEEQALLDSCGDNICKRRCFRPVLPVTVELPDGTTASATTKEELKTIFKTWKEENPDATERPSLVFPYEVQFRDGSTATVNNEEELQALKDACE